MSGFGVPAAAFVLAALLAAPASAGPIAGQLSILGTVRLDSDDIDFQAPIPMINNFVTAEPSDGYFSGITVDSRFGTALDLHDPAVGVPFSLPDFLSSFPGPFSALSFELTLIQPDGFGSADCAEAPAARQVCTPDGSPFSFVNFATGSDVSSILSFIVHGNVSADPDDTGSFTGLYTAQFVGLSYQEVLATIAGGGSVWASYSANFQVVPEPAAAALLLAGLAGLAAVSRSARAQR